jgi:hypothetical protein
MRPAAHPADGGSQHLPHEEIEMNGPWNAARTRLAGSTLILALALSLAGAPARAAGLDYFLEIDGVPGESSDKREKGNVIEFEISGPGEPARIGLLLPAVQKVRESSALAEIACSGRAIPQAVLTCRKSGSDAFMLIELTDVLVTSLGTRGTPDGLVDEVVLSFGRATMTGHDGVVLLAMDCSSGECACVR